MCGFASIDLRDRALAVEVKRGDALHAVARQPLECPRREVTLALKGLYNFHHESTKALRNKMENEVVCWLYPLIAKLRRW